MAHKLAFFGGGGVFFRPQVGGFPSFSLCPSMLASQSCPRPLLLFFVSRSGSGERASVGIGTNAVIIIHRMEKRRERKERRKEEQSR